MMFYSALVDLINMDMLVKKGWISEYLIVMCFSLVGERSVSWQYSN